LTFIVCYRLQTLSLPPKEIIMAHPLALVASSNLPHREKSAIRQWYERVSGTVAHPIHSIRGMTRHVPHTVSALRQGGESLIVGGALGALHVELPTGLDVKKIPVDAVAGAVLLAAGSAASEVAQDMRTAGSTALGVYAFRKTHDFLEEKKRQRGGAAGSAVKKAGMHGEFGNEDPIIAAARAL
jgi:hypothetical protein